MEKPTFPQQSPITITLVISKPSDPEALPIYTIRISQQGVIGRHKNVVPYSRLRIEEQQEFKDLSKMTSEAIFRQTSEGTTRRIHLSQAIEQLPIRETLRQMAYFEAQQELLRFRKHGAVFNNMTYDQTVPALFEQIPEVKYQKFGKDIESLVLEQTPV